MKQYDILKQLRMNRWVQIEQCASGCISGTLAEWPDLAAALEFEEIRLHSSTTASTLKQICQLLMIESGQLTSRLKMSDIQRAFFEQKKGVK